MLAAIFTALLLKYALCRNTPLFIFVHVITRGFVIILTRTEQSTENGRATYLLAP